MKNCSVIILTAGLSKRMGQSKALLIFDKNKNITFYQKITQTYENFGTKKIIVVTNKFDEKFLKKITKNNKTEIIVNQNPEKGRIHSLKLGINKLINEQYIFVQNIDNPFINTEILTKIYNNKNENAYTVPAFNKKGGHPILIPKKIFTQIHNISTQIHNLKKILQPFDKNYVIFDKNTVLININNKENYNRLFELKIKN